MLTQTDRVAVLGALERMDRELSQIASYISDDHERASVLVEDAARSLWAAQCLIDRDARQVLKLAPHGRLNSA